MSVAPEVATNRAGNTVAQALTEYWQQLLGWRGEEVKLAIATAYINPGGYGLLADQLEEAGQVRLLIGAPPDVAEEMYRRRPLRRNVLPEDERDERLRDQLRCHHLQLEEDRDLIAFDRTQDKRVKRMIEWLREGRVEVRRLEDRFLHGKAYIVETDNTGVLAGSSNLTYAGLTRNVELNLGLYQPQIVGQVLDWYDELWNESEPFDLAGLYERRFEEHDPFIIYLRMLWERYRDEAGREEPKLGLKLTQFQRDGLYRAMDILRKHRGVLVADGVGLGKTYIAGELMRQARQDLRQRVLLIAPASLRDGTWARFLRDHDREGLLGIQVVSFQQLAQVPKLNGTGEGKGDLWWDPDEYAMVVIDEAHAYRNPDTERAETLRRLLSGTPSKKLVLLTATPVNNSLWDLYSLLNFFIKNDAAFLPDAGIRSLREHFAEAEAQDPEALTPDRLFDVLDAVAVRRTRRFVKRFYPNEVIHRPDGTTMTITFPDPVVTRVDYDLDKTMPGFFARFAHALGVDPNDDNPLPSPKDFAYDETERLSLARYAPSAFLLEEDPDAYELQASGLLRSNLLKRFESSVAAFAKTCRAMADSHDLFLEALNDGWVLSGDALAAFAKSDTDEFDPEEIGKGRRERASLYDLGELRVAVEADRDLLLDFAENAERVSLDKDPKLDALCDALAKIASQAEDEAIDADDERDKRKVIVFSYYADTVDWIRRRLERSLADDPRLAAFRDRLVYVTGSTGDADAAVLGFVPKSSEAPDSVEDAFDILVTTDVLAEGVNLQQARHIINFDLPWNPMRLVQRHGRIDRIGSPHPRVFLRCFFPSDTLNALLGLEEALKRKLAQASKSIGVEGQVMPGAKAGDEHVFSHTRDQIEQLLAEDPTLFEEGEETGAVSGEEFRRELENALKDKVVKRQVESLPWVGGAGFATDGEEGFVFCARVGSSENPVYRWVPLSEDRRGVTTEGLSGDTLTCLAKASCDFDTERVLPDALADLAYDGWEVACDDIFEEWQRETDPRNLSRAIPKPMRDAAELLRDHPPSDLELPELDRLVETVEAPYDTRVQRMMRHAIDEADTPAAKVQAVRDVVQELGLEPPAPPEPRPEITRHDVHLVCWLALSAADA